MDRKDLPRNEEINNRLDKMNNRIDTLQQTIMELQCTVGNLVNFEPGSRGEKAHKNLVRLTELWNQADKMRESA